MLVVMRFVDCMQRGDVGDECYANDKCRSALCAPRANPEDVERARAEHQERLAQFELRLAAADGEEARALVERQRPQPGKLTAEYPGACTQACDDDDECPEGLTCGSPRFEADGFGPGLRFCFTPSDPMMLGSVVTGDDGRKYELR